VIEHLFVVWAVGAVFVASVFAVGIHLMHEDGERFGPTYSRFGAAVLLALAVALWPLALVAIALHLARADVPPV